MGPEHVISPPAEASAPEVVLLPDDGEATTAAGFDGGLHVNGHGRRFGLASRLVADSDSGTGSRILDADVAQARAGGDPRLLGECLAASGRAHLLVGEVPTARQRLLECLAVARGVDQAALAPDVHVGLGWAALVEGHQGPAETHLRLALALARSVDAPEAHAAALVWSGELAASRGADDLAQGHYEEALAVAAEGEIADSSVRAMVGLGRLAHGRGDLDAAHQLYDDALSLATHVCDAYLVGACQVALGALAIDRAQRDRARRLLDGALVLARCHCDRGVEAAALHQLGRLARSQDDLTAATAYYHQALGLRIHTGDRPGVAESLEALGGVEVADGHPERGVRLLAAGHALRSELGFPRRPADAAGYNADVCAAQATLGAAEFSHAWAAGARLSAEEGAALALCTGLAGPATPSDALTPAQCRVVELVADGLTNRQIAQRLGVSLGTVQGHLRGAFAALGLSNRDALVAEMPSNVRKIASRIGANSVQGVWTAHPDFRRSR